MNSCDNKILANLEMANECFKGASKLRTGETGFLIVPILTHRAKN